MTHKTHAEALNAAIAEIELEVEKHLSAASIPGRASRHRRWAWARKNDLEILRKHLALVKPASSNA